MFRFNLLLLLCISAFVLSCKSSDVNPTTEKSLIKDYVEKYKKANTVLKVTFDADTILYVVFTKVNANKADTLSKGKSVTINSVGKFLDGTKFDDFPQTFLLGTGAVITGLDAGISQMKKGEKAIIIFTSIVGYGSTKAYGNVNAKGKLKIRDTNGNVILDGNGNETFSYVPIPADTPLIFEVEVVK
jgi:FKBP-type peptidyl-prolyl cis-trans isomerase